MDIDALSKGVGLFSSAIAALKQVINLVPDSAKKKEAAAALEQAQKEFQLAEVETAKELGHEICYRHFPPGIMLMESDTHWKCPKCGTIIGPERFGGWVKS